jgi:GH43 family beta-xylosidase
MRQDEAGQPSQGLRETRRYTNPVYREYFADPFVWKHQGTYYAVGTGAQEAIGKPVHDVQPVPEAKGDEQPRVFSLLRSDDFATWHQVGKAMIRPDPRLGYSFWAPEVAYHEQSHFLYYSVGHEDKGHQLRVAVSSRPEGPYRDVGRSLLDPSACSFVIDPHPFHDEDGRWYLFYARDFLDTKGGARAGTALVVQRLEGMTRLAGEETIVMRAGFDWQRYQKDRVMYGQVYDWHTLEGPCVRKHQGRYYCFYSGGRWETENYGVDYGEADSVLGPYIHPTNLERPRVLQSIPGRVLGPGHNSIALGPDGDTEYVIYHAWSADMTARRMCLDKLLWTPDGPRCAGPTWEPQTLP